MKSTSLLLVLLLLSTSSSLGLDVTLDFDRDTMKEMELVDAAIDRSSQAMERSSQQIVASMVTSATTVTNGMVASANSMSESLTASSTTISNGAQNSAKLLADATEIISNQLGESVHEIMDGVKNVTAAITDTFKPAPDDDQQHFSRMNVIIGLLMTLVGVGVLKLFTSSCLDCVKMKSYGCCCGSNSNNSRVGRRVKSNLEMSNRLDDDYHPLEPVI